MPMLIRIRPEETRVSHSIRLSSGRIQKFERGKWYEVADPELIKICAETRSTFGNPNSSLLFDVKSKLEAAAVHREETAAKTPPAPTPEKPIVIPSSDGGAVPSASGGDDGAGAKTDGDDGASTKTDDKSGEKNESKAKTSGKR